MKPNTVLWIAFVVYALAGIAPILYREHGKAEAATIQTPKARMTEAAFNINVWKTAQKVAVLTATAVAPVPTKTATPKPTP